MAPKTLRREKTLENQPLFGLCALVDHTIQRTLRQTGPLRSGTGQKKFPAVFGGMETSEFFAPEAHMKVASGKLDETRRLRTFRKTSLGMGQKPVSLVETNSRPP
jgi:hypothetical protein